jgi:hypothetical protein
MELLFRSLGAKPAAAAAKRVVLPFSVIERKSIGRLA